MCFQPSIQKILCLSIGNGHRALVCLFALPLLLFGRFVICSCGICMKLQCALCVFIFFLSHFNCFKREIFYLCSCALWISTHSLWTIKGDSRWRKWLRICRNCIDAKFCAIHKIRIKSCQTRCNYRWFLPVSVWSILQGF